MLENAEVGKWNLFELYCIWYVRVVDFECVVSITWRRHAGDTVPVNQEWEESPGCEY